MGDTSDLVDVAASIVNFNSGVLDTAPTILSIGAAPANGDLDAGKTVTLNVHFSEAVFVNASGGTPYLTLNDGGTATYASGSGTSVLSFTYVVAAKQNTPDLTVTGLILNGASIQDGAGNNAVLTGAVTNPAGILQIDTVAPTILSVGAGPANGDLDAGKTVTLNVHFSEAVNVFTSDGTPILILNDGGKATYTSGSGTKVLSFTYVIVAGQNTADLAVTALVLSGGTIEDGAGNKAVLTGAATNLAGTLQIDTVAPTIFSVGAVPANADLDAGKTVTLNVHFSEVVNVFTSGGTPILILNDGGKATYASGSGTKVLSFTYLVAAGQNTADLAVTGLALSGGTIEDGAGNKAVLTGAVTNPAGTLKIDTAAPTISSVDAGPANGDLDAGKTVTLKVHFSEVVTVAGVTPSTTPFLTLNDGGIATYASGSGTNALAFTYVVAAGQNTPDLTVTGLTLNGATIQDGAGNNAVLTGAVTNPAGVLQIDTIAPTILSVVANPANADLDAGKTVTLTVNFSETVNVFTSGGTPILNLNDGGKATYTSGSGTSALVFTYVVAVGQNTADLAVTGLALSGGTIEDGAGNKAVLTGAVTNPAGTLQIDTIAPTIFSVGAGSPNGDLDAGKTVTLNVHFSEAVTVAGVTPSTTPFLTLNDGGTATYTRGSGTKVLSFTYVVAAGQNTPDLAVTGLTLNGATIQDGAGNNAVLTGAATSLAGTLQIDTTAPTILSVAANPANGDLDAGNTVTLTVNFSEAVFVDTSGGTPLLALNDNGTATYASGSGTTALSFTYVVAAGQNTADLAATGLTLNGGTIEDGAGNNAVLTGAATSLGGTLQIDTTAPTVGNVTTARNSDQIVTGTLITISLDMSEAVTVSGAPLLLLNDGGTGSYDSTKSSAKAAVFEYTVGSSDVTTDLEVSGIQLSSISAIEDLAGNPANLAGAGINFGFQVNTTNTGSAGPSGGTFAVTGSTALDLFGPSIANVTFGTGSTGTLELTDSSQFAGTVAGLALGNYLDLADIAYVASNTPAYTPNSGNTGGTLSVTDGTHTANITLFGQYAASSFTTASDGHGGTLVTDPPLVQQQLLSTPRA